MVQVLDKKKCCGCTACANVCPKKCIEMLEDEEGFLYPVVDKEKCVDCGLCEKVCPVTNCDKSDSDRTEAYVVQNKDSKVLESCTSGGFIDALNVLTINKGGYVVGVAYNEEFVPVHKIAHSISEVQEFRSSKYAQSVLGDTYSKVKGLVKDGALVTFVGTPCQVAGLKKYMGKDYENLVLVDLVCRSIPSPKFWKEYLEYQQKKHKADIVRVNCRAKTYGYHSGALEIDFKNGKKYAGSNRVDIYMKSFHSDICSRPSCYECAFKTRERCSDYTVFDCWYPEKVTTEDMMDNHKGYSNVIVRSQKGKELLLQMDNMDIYKADMDKMFLYTGEMESKSIKKNDNRKEFYSFLRDNGVEATGRKFLSITLADRMIEGLKPIVYTLKRRKNSNG